MITFACITPHPPIILPSVGSPEDRAQVKKTIAALENLGKKLKEAKKEAKPDSIIISSPHPDWGIKVPLYFLISNSCEIPDGIYKNQKSTTAPPSHPFKEMHSITKIQLKIQNYQSPDKILIEPPNNLIIYPILTTFDSPIQHYEWGKEFYLKIKNLKLKIALIASGDLSHCLKKDGPYGFHPDGPKFDKTFIEALKNKDIKTILKLDEMYPNAGECGLRSFCFLLGILDFSGLNWQPEILCYEGPFGVGYLVANFQLS